MDGACRRCEKDPTPRRYRREVHGIVHLARNVYWSIRLRRSGHPRGKWSGWAWRAWSGVGLAGSEDLVGTRPINFVSPNVSGPDIPGRLLEPSGNRRNFSIAATPLANPSTRPFSVPEPVASVVPLTFQPPANITLRHRYKREYRRNDHQPHNDEQHWQEGGAGLGGGVGVGHGYCLRQRFRMGSLPVSLQSMHR